MKSWIQKNRNNLIAIGIFLVVVLIYFRPMLSGMKLMSHDILSWEYFSHEAKSYAEKTGELTAWTNSIFGGMPTYTFYMNIKSNILLNIYLFVLDHVMAAPMIYFFICMISMYILLSVSKLDAWSKTALALMGTFVSYSTIITGAGHYGKMFTIALFPAILAGVIMLYGGKLWKGIATLLVSLGLTLAMGMQQIEYYMAFIFVFLGLYELYRAVQGGSIQKWFTRTGIILGIFLLSVMGSMTNFTPLLEYSNYTMRGGKSELTLNKDEKDQNKTGGLDKDYAFSWSNAWGESLTTIVPYLYGGASGEALAEDSQLGETLSELGVPYQSVAQFTANAPTYWGSQPFVSGPIYFGAAVMFLFVLALLYYRHPSKWWIIAGIIITFFISLGGNFKSFNYFMFDYFPLFNKFRSPTMVLSLTYVLIVYLASMNLYHFIKDEKPIAFKLKKLYISAGIIGGICLIIAILGSSLFSFSSPNDTTLQEQLMASFQDQGAVTKVINALKEDRASMAASSAWRSLLFVLLAAAGLFAYLKNMLKTPYIIAIVAVIGLIDNMGIANKYLNEDKFVSVEDYESNFYPRAVDNQILADTDPFYRVLDYTVNVYNDAKPAYFHKLIGGYSPAKLESYQDLIDMHMGGAYSGGKFNSEVLNMLNTKYLIFGNRGQEQVAARSSANGNAWFVSEIQWVKSADEEMLAMNANFEGDTTRVSNPWDSKKQIILREDAEHAELKKMQLASDSSARIELVEYGLPHLKFRSKNTHEGLAVFSDIYYPAGWNAYIDDKPTAIYKANYLLRALKVPAGEHTIEFRFEPKTLKSAITMSGIGSVISLLLLGFALYQNYRKPDDVDELADEV